MDRITVQSKIGSDGILQLSVPVGIANAEQEVQVTVEPLVKGLSSTQWKELIFDTAGKWQGDFERPPQGDYEQRESLP